MDRLFGTISGLADPQVGGGDSFSDRLNSQQTVSLLLFFSLFITVREHYVGRPISCWHPEHFTESHENYTDRYCWVRNTYYLPFDKEIPKEVDPRDEIRYYQWVGFILCFMAIMFYMPRVIWTVLNRRCGISVTTITDAAIQLQRKGSEGEREKILSYMANHLSTFLKEVGSRQAMSRTSWYYALWRIYGNLLTIFYLLVKLAYVLNIFAQLFLINSVLGFPFHELGTKVIERLRSNQEVSVSYRFPRVTMCDFKVRLLGNTHRYTVQCALPVNLYNEMVFTFLWFWFIILAAVSISSMLMWTWRALYQPRQIHYIKARLIAMEKLSEVTDLRVEDFVRQWLHRDGLFIIHLVSKNASGLIAAELVCELWDCYKDFKRSKRRREIRGINFINIVPSIAEDDEDNLNDCTPMTDMTVMGVDLDDEPPKEADC